MSKFKINKLFFSLTLIFTLSLTSVVFISCLPAFNNPPKITSIDTDMSLGGQADETEITVTMDTNIVEGMSVSLSCEDVLFGGTVKLQTITNITTNTVIGCGNTNSSSSLVVSERLQVTDFVANITNDYTFYLASPMVTNTNIISNGTLISSTLFLNNSFAIPSNPSSNPHIPFSEITTPTDFSINVLDLNINQDYTVLFIGSVDVNNLMICGSTNLSFIREKIKIVSNIVTTESSEYITLSGKYEVEGTMSLGCDRQTLKFQDFDVSDSAPGAYIYLGDSGSGSTGDFIANGVELLHVNYVSGDFDIVLPMSVDELPADQNSVVVLCKPASILFTRHYLLSEFDGE